MPGAARPMLHNELKSTEEPGMRLETVLPSKAVTVPKALAIETVAVRAEMMLFVPVFLIVKLVMTFSPGP